MKTVRDVLGDYSDEQLAPIFRLWAVEPDPHVKRAKQLDVLLQQMRDPLAARFAIEHITDDERQVLYRVLPPATRNGIVRDKAFLKRLPIPIDRISPTIEQLVASALLQKLKEASARNTSYFVVSSSSRSQTEKFPVLAGFNESVESLYQIAREYFTPSGDRTNWELDRLIETIPYAGVNQALKDYELSTRVVSGVFYSRNDAYGVVLEHLTSIEEPLDYLPKLDPITRRVFIWLREHGGKAPLQHVREVMQISDAVLMRTLETLMQYGLAFDSFSKGVRVLFVPEILYSTWKPLGASSTPNKETATLVALDKEPLAIHPAESVTVYDIATLVSNVYQQTIEPTQAGSVPKRIATKIRPNLRGLPRPNYDESDSYLEMVLTVMRSFAILRLTKPPFQDIKSAYEAHPTLEKWAHILLLEQVQLLLAYWQNNYDWRDVYGVNYTAWSTYSWNNVSGRAALIKHLLTCTPDRWYTVESLLQVLWKTDPFAYRPLPPYSRTARPKKDEDTHIKWDRCEGEVYRGVLASTLREFGIVDIGYEQVDALSAKAAVNPDFFMVTEFGNKALAAYKDTTTKSPNLVVSVEEHQQSLVVQPNFELLLLQQDFATLYALLPFAQANGLGMVSRLTLTKGSVTRGMQAGLNVEQMLRILQEHSQREIPQNVEYTLRDWTKAFKSSKLSQVLLFEVSSEEAGQILASLPILQKTGLRQLTPYIFAINGVLDVPAIRKELEKAAVFVRISGDIFTHPQSRFNSDFTFDMYQ